MELAKRRQGETMSLVGHIGGHTADAPPHATWLGVAAEPEPGELGAKAAALARAHGAGLPVLDGFVIPVGHPDPTSADDDDVRAAWAELSDAGTRALAVRSSSPVEDGDTSSMAGVFDSVLDVQGWDAFVDACATVRASARDAPMAILVQPMITPTLGGVLFGVDPVSGRTDRWSIAAVEGGPHHLVDGSVDAAEFVVDRSGRVLSRSGAAQPALSRRRRRALVSLERRSRDLFGGPQDIEWGIHDDRVVLLQSRPVTAVGAVAVGPLLGPGPVAETHPDPLDTLELDLWVPPLRDAMHEVLVLLGQTGRRRLARRPAVHVVERQVAVDLVVTGDATGGRGRLARALDPRPGLRRLRAAWRVGRLRAALPTLGWQLVHRVDEELARIPALDQLDDEHLTRLLRNGADHLRAVHAHEMLAGGLLDDPGTTAADAALDALAAGRTRGWSEDEIVARTPIVLALVTPRVAGERTLPRTDRAPVGDAPRPALTLREALRLRARWLHELHRRAAREAGRRLVERDRLDDVDQVAHLSLPVLEEALAGREFPHPEPPTTVQPLPGRFRLSAEGVVVAESSPSARDGIPAGGGRGAGGAQRTAPGRRPRRPVPRPVLGRLPAHPGRSRRRDREYALAPGDPRPRARRAGGRRRRLGTGTLPGGHGRPRRRRHRGDRDRGGRHMRRIPLLLMAAVGAVCAAYTVIYLVRWEWNRALIAAIFFVAVEVLFVGALVLDRLRRIEQTLAEVGEQTRPAPETDVALDALRATAPDPPDRFAWIRDQSTSTNVFLPVLLGAGIAASALAWVVERVAHATVTPSLERRLAQRLGTVAAPAGGLLDPPSPPAVAPRRPWFRHGLIAVLLAAGALATGAGIDAMADRIQTRPVERRPVATTTIDVQMQGTLADRNPERMFGHLWATCTAPGVLPGRGIQDYDVAHGGAGLFRVVVDFDIGANYEERLRGCLEDATIERVRADVLAIDID